MITIHKVKGKLNIAEVLPGSGVIDNPQDMLDIMADAGYNDCGSLIIHEDLLSKDFFDLKTKLAGEILQKFSNYRMKLAIVGDFSKVSSKSLQDFIRESNRRGVISFVSSTEEAFLLLRKSYK